MSAVWVDAGLVVAGVGSGLAGSMAGLASLVSYPALLAAGLGPVAANVTNTTGLVLTSVGSVWGSHPDLRGQRARVIGLLPVTVLGGILGGVAALVTDPQTFADIVPWLIALGSALILVPRSRLARAGGVGASLGDAVTPVGRPDPLTLLLTFAITFYGGYFGAAAGVLMLASFLAVFGGTLARANALKNLLLGVANFVAALAFAVSGPVHWVDAGLLGAGCLVGGRLGPPLVRRLPATFVRGAIAVAGLSLAIYLGAEAYR